MQTMSDTFSVVKWGTCLDEMLYGGRLDPARGKRAPDRVSFNQNTPKECPDLPVRAWPAGAARFEQNRPCRPGAGTA